MASGRIEGNKIKVTGFTTATAETVNKEELYDVTLSGISTAQTLSGNTILSNRAFIRREKHAFINLGAISRTHDLCSSATITVKNIQEDSLYVVGVPGFISSYSITRDGDSYVLELCSYPNYGESAESGTTVIGGYDVYGNLILSNERTVFGSSGISMGSIKLFCVDDGLDVTSITVNANETVVNITCKIDGDIKPESLRVLLKSDEMNVDPMTPTEISVSFPNNGNRFLEKNYSIQIFGLNKYNDIVKSNTFKITQEKNYGWYEFYVDGKNIRFDEMLAVFNIHYKEEQVSDIGVYGWSENITGIDFDGEHTVSASTEINKSSEAKSLLIYVSGSTVDGKTLYANGMLVQNPDSLILVSSEDGWVSAGTATVDCFTQTFTFDYKASNVSGLSVSIDGGGTVVIDKTKRSVVVSFEQNTDEEDRVFTVTLSGYNTLMGEISATYEITQEATESTDFELYYLDENDVRYYEEYEFDSGTTEFRLWVSNADKYTGINVSDTESTSTQYRIYNTEIGCEQPSGECYVDCFVYKNEGPFECEYEITVSGLSRNGKTKYTNPFHAHHLPQELKPDLHFNQTGKTVSASATTTTFGFTYENMDTIYVDSSTSSDKSFVRIDEFSYDEGNGTIRVTFENYPETAKTITIKIKGTDTKGQTYPDGDDSRCTYTIKQKYAEKMVSVIPSEISVNYDELNITGITVERKPDGQMRFLEPLYDDTVFSEVTDTGATLFSENNGVKPIENIITYRGVLNDEIYIDSIKIIQNGRPISPEIKIESTFDLWVAEENAYVVGIEENSYQLLFTTLKDVDPTSLVGQTDSPEYATIIPPAGTISLSEVTGGGEKDDNVIGRIVDNNTISAAVGNDSKKYVPKLTEIRKDVYEYWIELDKYSGKEVERTIEIWVTGIGYNNNECHSNRIKFIQRGKIQPEN